MTNEILLALIAKDTTELDKIFTAVETPEALNPAYLRHALEKSQTLTANIDTLLANLLTPEPVEPAEPVEQPACPPLTEPQPVIDPTPALMEHLDTIIAEREATLRREVAEANRALYTHIEQTRADLTDTIRHTTDTIIARFNPATNPVPAPVPQPASDSQPTPAPTPTIDSTPTPTPVADIATEIATEIETAIEQTIEQAVEQTIEPTLTPEPQPEEPQPSESDPQAQVHPQPSAPTVAETIHTPVSILDRLADREDRTIASALNNAKISDLKAAISIADRFRFQRELFSGDGERMNRTINDLNIMTSLPDAERYIEKNFNWSPENPVVADFLHLLQRRYL